MASSFLILVGSFTPMISTLNFTLSPPSLSLVSQTASGTSASWLTANPTNTSILYATDEIEEGALNSLVLEHTTGKITPVGSISTQGKYPTHIGFSSINGRVAVANYGSGSTLVAVLGDDQLQLLYPLLRKFDEVPASNPHQAVALDFEIIVPDLAADRVWRTVEHHSGQMVISGSISQPSGSGPRRIVIDGRSLYTLHEKTNTLIQQAMPTSSGNESPDIVSSISIIPDDTPSSATLYAGELLIAHSPSTLLYASNREDPSPGGDAIAIFQTNPLTKVATIRTGLNHLRGVALVGPNDAYLIAGGMKGGGIKIYERVSADQGYLKEVASLPAGVIERPSSFIWSPQKEGASVTEPLATLSTTNTAPVQPTVSRSAGCRRFKIGV
ncbi:3-carboxy-cis,cis-mucoante lactonizing enzyme [Serendipita vermifera]|nr:3-carboxy-cis,cis-mucoante lactonizing enzyme [Serendipita vermifera]